MVNFLRTHDFLLLFENTSISLPEVALRKHKRLKSDKDRRTPLLYSFRSNFLIPNYPQKNGLTIFVIFPRGKILILFPTKKKPFIPILFFLFPLRYTLGLKGLFGFFIRRVFVCLFVYLFLSLFTATAVEYRKRSPE